MRNLHITLIVISVMSIAILGLEFRLGSYDSRNSCKFIGCQGNLYMNFSEKIVDDLDYKYYIEADNQILADWCNPKIRDGKERRGIREGINVHPHSLNHSSSNEVIDELKVGIRPECGENPRFNYNYSDINVNYSYWKPGGDACSGCYYGKLMVNENRVVPKNSSR